MARCALCFILLGLCVTSSAQAVCNSDEESRNLTKGAHLSCCGTTAYNKLESSCCNNVVTAGLSQTVSYCCGREAYNPINQICCNGSIRNKGSAHTECCGSGLYDTKKQLCCQTQFIWPKDTDNHVCCGNATLNLLKQCCCAADTLKVENLDSTCCKEKLKRDSAGHSNANQPANSIHPLKDHGQMVSQDSARSETLCGSLPYNPIEDVCCSGQQKTKKSGVTQCCGEETYELSEEGVLCCDGQLYRGQPAGSVCAGNVPYSPHNCTVCQKHVHLPAGQQCCGQKTFDPHEEICCNGHRHKRTADMACCGSHAYNASSGEHMCCSGHLHDLTHLNNKQEAECCGPLLLTNKKEQQCCHSTEKTLVYKTQPGHSCCGHWYYSMSLWSCCAGQLIPKPTQAKMGEPKCIRKLWDYSQSAICNMPVLLGTVQSVAVKHNERSVMVGDALEVNATNVTSCGNSLEVGPLDHCLFPALELGGTYLWIKNTQNKYEPLADVTGLTNPLHAILSLCQSRRRYYTA
ncbi:galaxin-like isoform X2 [Colossoma macropomum]|uniref:galaxin-like isoform X2 n=1 Tax=Colossoma macropomum TaxID=42526 RepID=UPI001864E665|nr:galaxin-like isoform X2 [Colossoma macropomum]